MTMTTSTSTWQDITRDTARRGEETYAKAVHLWADSVQKVLGSLLTPDPKLLHEVVDSYFNVAEHVLTTQRKFAQSMLTAATSAVTEARSVTQDAAKNAAAKTS
jgi:hypothetical protein